MPAPESIEAALARLMPPALSGDGQASIDAMLDELADAGSAATPAPRPRQGVPGFVMASGIAAALAALAAVWLTPSGAEDAAPAAAAHVPASGLVLVGEADRVEEMTDAGWLTGPGGQAMEAVRVRLVEQNIFRDEQTGMILSVSEPREEILLTPITAF